MADTTYGVYHLANNPTAFQPMRTNNFIFVVDDKLAELLAEADNDYIGSEFIDSTRKILEYSVVSFDPPHFSQDEINVSRGNSTTYFAGKPKFDSKPLKINDFAGSGGKSILEAWQALSYNVENDTVGTSDKYKVNATVLEYLPDNTLVRYWDLKGCWVQGINEDGWNAESSDKKTVTATIRYDWAIPHRNALYDNTIAEKA